MAQDTLGRLKALNLIQLVDGRWTPSDTLVVNPVEIPSAAVRSFHRQILEASIQALDSQSVDERLSESLCIAISHDDLPEFKKELNQFLDRMENRFGKMNRNKKDRVYGMTTQFFRVSKG